MRIWPQVTWLPVNSRWVTVLETLRESLSNSFVLGLGCLFFNPWAQSWRKCTWLNPVVKNLWQTESALWSLQTPHSLLFDVRRTEHQLQVYLLLSRSQWLDEKQLLGEKTGLGRVLRWLAGMGRVRLLGSVLIWEMTKPLPGGGCSC